jgi:predicted transcriptional regulator
MIVNFGLTVPPWNRPADIPASSAKKIIKGVEYKV